MRKNFKSHKDKTISYAPVYQPAHIEVILDEGHEEMRGSMYRCRVLKVESVDGLLRIIVSKT